MANIKKDLDGRWRIAFNPALFLVLWRALMASVWGLLTDGTRVSVVDVTREGFVAQTGRSGVKECRVSILVTMVKAIRAMHRALCSLGWRTLADDATVVASTRYTKEGAIYRAIAIGAWDCVRPDGEGIGLGNLDCYREVYAPDADGVRFPADRSPREVSADLPDGYWLARDRVSQASRAIAWHTFLRDGMQVDQDDDADAVLRAFAQASDAWLDAGREIGRGVAPARFPRAFALSLTWQKAVESARIRILVALGAIAPPSDETQKQQQTV